MAFREAQPKLIPAAKGQYSIPIHSVGTAYHAIESAGKKPVHLKVADGGTLTTNDRAPTWYMLGCPDGHLGPEPGWDVNWRRFPSERSSAELARFAPKDALPLKRV